uniref:alkaline phosphatase family protein n=1 Tax=Marinobacterium profundum TaxID=1714300 RepID=UPI00082DBA4F|nr:alkaline phosphatase family protein [Marinobacterium profundum]
MKNIEHVVVLMLENRSFDSMLGWLYEKGEPARNVPDLKPGERAYEGLQGLDLNSYQNVDSTGTIKVSPIRGVQGLNVPNVSPGEDFFQVNTQLFGTESPDATAIPSMNGYVRDYANLLRKQKYPEDKVKLYAQQVMQSHTPDQLPVLNGLAEHYAVCDMWFSSVPSQTNPNRAFAFCGTSMGLADNGFLEEDKRAPLIEKIVGYKLGDDRFKTTTVFNALADDGKTTWKIFRESGMLQSNIDKMSKILLPIINVFMQTNPLLVPAGITADILLGYLIELSSSKLESDYVHRLFPEILKIKDADSNFGKLDDFHIAARSGQLPNFTFIEPEWTIGEKGTGEGELMKKALFHQGDDYHPPGNADAAENLVKQVYLSIIANKAAWEKTLLIITFDEPVGSYDHVPPPAAIPPWGEGKTPDFKRQHDFKFDRYGGRVPAILVSPWVEKGTVFRSSTNVPFDHTSLIATILKWRGLGSRIGDFGERTKQAPTFDDIVSLVSPRTDKKDVRFLKLAHKIGDPVRYYDRFYLKASNGKYISIFQEHEVAPFSIFSEDSAMSEYFPTLGYEPFPSNANVTATQFYLQNASNRPDSGAVENKSKTRLNAGDNGLGSYNVLGAWKDSHDCYYFNDYMEGDNCRKQTWILQTVKGASALSFGDQVCIINEYYNQGLAPDSRYNGYVTTNKNENYWTVEPILDDQPGSNVFRRGDEFYLKNLKTGKYVKNNSKYKGGQWYPTLGDASARIKLKIPSSKYGPMNENGMMMTNQPIFDGAITEIISTESDLIYKGKRCDVLLAWNDKKDIYYYYEGYSADYQAWIISLVGSSGMVKDGDHVRLINKGYDKLGKKQVIVADGSFLTTATDAYNQDSIWVLEKAN